MNSILNRFPIKQKLFVNNKIRQPIIYRKIDRYIGKVEAYRSPNFTKITLEMIDDAIDDAIYHKGTSEEATYWDIVHELVVYYQKQRQLIQENMMDGDELRMFCEDDESQPECRIYDL